jgi:hypothetical protein
MDPHISVVTALLHSIAYNTHESDAQVVPEAEFVRFDFSYLRDYPVPNEPVRNPFGGRDQHAADALPA